MALRYLTAGESHGPALTGILEGMPAGVEIRPEDFTALMRRRQAGYGRGRRCRIETDAVEVLSGVTGGITTGSPIALLLRNADFAAHAACMHPFNRPAADGEISTPLPGHADLPGVLKYGFKDCRPIRERASARETAMRTALSVPARNLLASLGVRSTCFIESIGGIRAEIDWTADPAALAQSVVANGEDFLTPDAAVIPSWKTLIDEHTRQNISLGGSGAVIFYHLPVGLGSHVHYDRRLDGILAGLVMSIPAVRGCEIGLALELSTRRSSAVDSIRYQPESGFVRDTNHCGGLEGGMTNGMPLIIRFHMKPLPANSAAESVDLRTMQPAQPGPYRSDVQAVSAAAVVAESVVALQIASEILKITGGDCLKVVGERLTTL